MNKKELYNKILQLDGLTNEEKSELLGLLRKQKKYGLVWEDKPEDVEERLRIAKQLLSDRGVIFISIDDNEQAQLKLLCDEIFGERNFVGLISRATGTTKGQDTSCLGKACDYMLVYSGRENYIIGCLQLDEKNLGRYSVADEKGKFSILQLRRTGGEDRKEDRPTMFFPIIAPDGTEIYPYSPTGYERRWRVSPQKVKSMLADNIVYFKKDNNNEWKVYYKFYSENKTKRPSNLWTEIEGNKKAQIELKNILHNKLFETPKPIDLIRRILQITDSDSSTVLDFFAGSGTNLHATMQLNAEDGGHRKCILVTNNENNICEEVTYERNKRVINGYTTPKGEDVPGLKNNTLRYYRTSFVGRSRSMKNMRQLMSLSTDMLCIKEDLYAEQTKFGEQPIYKNVFRYFDNGKKRMMIIYKEEAVPLLADLIRRTDYEGKMRVYVFSPSEDLWEGEFEEVQDKVQLCALPQAIYNAYKRILPKKKDVALEQENDAASNDDKVFNGMFNFNEEEVA